MAPLKFKGIAIAFLMLVSAVCAADILRLQRSVVDPNGLNFANGALTKFSLNVNGRTFQRTPLVTFKGYQYVVYYNDRRNVCLGRRKLPIGKWDILKFTDYKFNKSDAHNVATVGICEKDGTIHLAFDHHARALNYRVSMTGVASTPEDIKWSKELFGPVVHELEPVGKITSVTYPSFINMPNGNLMLYYRNGGSGNGDGVLQVYDGVKHKWSKGYGNFISRSGTYSGKVSSKSSSRCPYINGLSYAGKRLHASWGWRETGGGTTNHDLNYAYSDDDGRTWNNNVGKVIGKTGSSPISIDSPGLKVATIPQNSGLSNQYTHYAYPDGSCHVMVEHKSPGTGTARSQHYWRDQSGNWKNAALPFNGGRCKIAGDSDGSLFMAYSAGGVLRIAKGTPNATKTAWIWNSIHSESKTSEGGAGLIDYTRWEQDRVLSVYGQENPSSVLSYGKGKMIDGLPSPVHVTDFQVTQQAIFPSPAIHAEKVSPDATLYWVAGLNALSHRIYLGTNRSSIANATLNSPTYMGEKESCRYVPVYQLNENTVYYWRVDEVQANGKVTPGFVWKFSTSPNSHHTVPATIEAELAERQADFAPFRVTTASEGSSYITWPSSGNENTDGKGIASYSFRVKKRTHVTIEVLAKLPKGADKAFSHQINQGQWTISSAQATNEWTWVTLASDLAIDEGSHTLRFACRADGAMIDRFRIKMADR